MHTGQLAAGQQSASSLPAGAFPLSTRDGDRLRRVFPGSKQPRVSGTDFACTGAVSSGLGIALASSTEGQVLEHIHFSRLSTGKVLAVLVTQAGAVQDRVLVLDHELTHLELETAARYLNDNFRGWPSSASAPR